MRNKINFKISIETNDLDQETYMKLQQPLFDRIVETEMPPMSFEEIDKILELRKKMYHVTGIEFPDMTADENSFGIKETTIEIKA